MTDGLLHPLPDDFATTRDALHLVAARVIAAARFESVGRLGLVPLAGGFGIPPGEARELAIVDGALSDGARTHELTTLAAAADFAGVDLGVAAHPALEMVADPLAPLHVDAASAGALADWYRFCSVTLEALVATAERGDDPTPIQLWPEHFDLAIEFGPARERANFGGSPGDEGEAEPYLYVGPHVQREDSFWNASFGALLSYRELLEGNDPMAFLQHGRDLLRAI